MDISTFFDLIGKESVIALKSALDKAEILIGDFMERGEMKWERPSENTVKYICDEKVVMCYRQGKYYDMNNIEIIL